MKTKICMVIAYTMIILLIIPSYVQAAGQEQGFAWGGTVQYWEVTKNGSISTNINLYKETTYRQFGKRRQDVLQSWMQNTNILPVVVEKYVMECMISSIGFEHIIEVGLSPDMGITRYKAHEEPGKGYIVDLIGSEMPLGGHGLNWYIVHKDNKGKLVIIWFVFTWAIQDTAMGGCFMLITRAPADWDEMPEEIQLSHNQGFQSVNAWSNQPEKVAQWRAERMKIGDVAINGKAGNFVEYHFGDNQVKNQLIQPNTNGFAINNIPAGTTVWARYQGQRKWYGPVTAVGGTTMKSASIPTLNLVETGALKIISSQNCEILMEGVSPNGGKQEIRTQVYNGEILYPDVMAGLTVRVCKLNENIWTNPIVIQPILTQTIDLDR